ncbi:MAG TPA: type IV secretion system DNA-binding domain-containing protein [Ktedonobacterales bacterium]
MGARGTQGVRGARREPAMVLIGWNGGRGATATLDRVARPCRALFALRLETVVHGGTKERLSSQSLLQTRLCSATRSAAAASRAVELRFIATPGTAESGWRDEVACYLLARVAGWAGDRAELRNHAAAFAADLRDLLASTLPHYRFAPVESVAELRRALRPFAAADLVEVRHRVFAPTTNGGIAPLPLPLPLLGAPDSDAIVELMLRQPLPTAAGFSFEPLPVEDDLALAMPIEAAGHEPEAMVGAVRREALYGEQLSVQALTRVHEERTTQRWQAQHLAALRQRAFRVRIHLAGAGRLSDALIATVAGEVGGPGEYTAEAAWQDPTLPLAGGARVVRPRSARLRGETRAEFATARESFEQLGFTPWGEEQDTACPSELTCLADLGEATRLFALPAAAPWLPARHGALALPYPGGVTEGLKLGVNRVRDAGRDVLLPFGARHHHVWMVGQTGTGKSTLLETLIEQDIHSGRGVIVIDPHGDLIHQVLGRIPASRTRDVILFDPADTAHPVGINPLEARGEDAQALVVSSFIGLLTKLYDPYHQGIVGPRFEHAARNGILTVMANGGTLIEVVRVFQDDAFVTTLLPNVTDPLVKRYWTDQIAKTADFHRSEILDWIVSKFGHFVTDPTMRRILGQEKSSFSFRKAMDSGKIVLLSLAKGLLGSENANFLGLILLPMVLHAALSRADLPMAQRRDVVLYVDEFQNYATDSLALMLAEARKYHLALTLANQHVGQLTKEIRDAVLGNVGSILSFRLGAADAAAMEQIFAPSPLAAEHLIGLPNFTAYGRLLIGGQHTPVFTVETEPVTRRHSAARAEAIRKVVRRTYARPRAKVDDEIMERAHLNDKPAPRRSSLFSLTS